MSLRHDAASNFGCALSCLAHAARISQTLAGIWPQKTVTLKKHEQGSDAQRVAMLQMAGLWANSLLPVAVELFKGSICGENICVGRQCTFSCP